MWQQFERDGLLLSGRAPAAVAAVGPCEGASSGIARDVAHGGRDNAVVTDGDGVVGAVRADPAGGAGTDGPAVGDDPRAGGRWPGKWSRPRHKTNCRRSGWRLHLHLHLRRRHPLHRVTPGAALPARAVWRAVRARPTAASSREPERALSSLPILPPALPCASAVVEPAATAMMAARNVIRMPGRTKNRIA